MEGFSAADFDIESVLNLFEDIQEELRHEELKMLAEFEKYEASVREEEDVLCSAIASLSAEEVICPVCQKNSLLQNKSVIFCKCGVRVDTEQDCLTLRNVKQLLDDGVKLHGKTCDTPPTFSVVSELGPKTYSCHASPVIGCLLSFKSNFKDMKSAGLCLIIVLWMMMMIMMMTICI